MICPKCGSVIEAGAKFCIECGAPVADPADAIAQRAAQPQQTAAPFTPQPAPPVQPAQQPTQPAYPQQPYQQQPYRQTPPAAAAAPQIPEQYRPLSAWAYFGLGILFSIPVVGFVFLIVYSCSSANLNRRSFARSYWCWLILIAVVFVILALTGVLAALTYRT